MNDKYAVFLDIDGTLLDNRSKMLSENSMAIKKARALGHKIFINTGRPTSRMLGEIYDFDTSYDGIITGLGARIIYEGNPVYSNYSSNEIAVKAAKILMPSGRRCFFDTEDIMYEYCPKGDMGSIIITSVEDVIKYKMLLSKIFVFYPPFTDNEYSAISELFDIHGYDGSHYELATKGNGKDRAIERIMALTGIDKEHTIAIGDSANDIPMIDFAGIGVAMGNAPSKVKEHADYIADINELSGVAKVIEKFLL